MAVLLLRLVRPDFGHQIIDQFAKNITCKNYREKIGVKLHSNMITVNISANNAPGICSRFSLKLVTACSMGNSLNQYQMPDLVMS